MWNWTDFDTVFRTRAADYSLDHKQYDATVRHRKEFGGTLYFDRIWNSIGLKQPQKSYPPKTNADLRSLWHKVIEADVADEKKQAILFYILRDCKQPANIDTIFARKTYLPLKYQVLVNGLWELDHGQYSRALEHLTDPCLSAEFADDILLTLLESKCDKTLAIAYALTVSPPLHKAETLDAYFQLLVQTNIVEAYRFAKRRDTESHRMLFENLLHLVHEEEQSPQKARQSVTMLSLPLTTEEKRWFEEYLLQGAGSKLPGARDSVLMRRIATGHASDGTENLNRYRGAKADGMNWDDIRAMHKSAIPSSDAD